MIAAVAVWKIVAASLVFFAHPEVRFALFLYERKSTIDIRLIG